jgi:hypothetical protein
MAKLPERPISSFFPDYSGEPDDAPASADYFAKRFRARGMCREVSMVLPHHHENLPTEGVKVELWVLSEQFPGIF